MSDREYRADVLPVCLKPEYTQLCEQNPGLEAAAPSAFSVAEPTPERIEPLIYWCFQHTYGRNGNFRNRIIPSEMSPRILRPIPAPV